MHKERAPVNRVNMLWFDDDLRPLSEGATLERARQGDMESAVSPG